jgi:cyclic-di-GMP phosphodiesterase TipF (flagellum assembly factor)
VLIASVCIRFDLTSPLVAWGIAGFLALLFGQIHALASRLGDRGRTLATFDDLREANLILVEEMETARARLDFLEARVDSDVTEGHAELAGEIKTLEDLVRRLGDRMEARLAEARRHEHGTPDRAAADRALSLAAVRDALEAGRVDLHLQPIVSLPQRKTVFYESFSRLRAADGGVIMPAEWLTVAEPAGLVTAIDNLLLFRCVQIVRRLNERERRIGIFCNISLSSLADETFFPQFLAFMGRNADLANSLIFEIGQAAFEQRSGAAARNMARLADLGFRFSIDKVDALDLDLADLKSSGVAFLKATGDMLARALRDERPLGLTTAPRATADDLVDTLAREGVALIAEKIEDEPTVVEVLDLDVAYGQGHLFGPPRPIREEILEAADARGLQAQVARRAG